MAINKTVVEDVQDGARSSAKILLEALRRALGIQYWHITTNDNCERCRDNLTVLSEFNKAIEKIVEGGCEKKM